MKDKIVMISGHRHLTQKNFDKYYINEIEKYRKAGYKFVIGDAIGADTMVQIYLSQYDDVDLTIYCVHPIKKISDKFEYIVFEGNYLERDIFLTKISSKDIAFIYHDSGSISYTCMNLLRRKYGQDIAEDVINIIQRYTIMNNDVN